MSNMILALVGMPGSGKSTCIESLKTRDIPSVYFGGIVVEETKRRHGGKTNEAFEKVVREEFRKKDGLAALAKRVVVRTDNLLKTNNRVVLDGLYSWSEYSFLQKHYGKELVVIAVVSDRELRYKRLETRPIRPLNHAEANSRDIAEIENLEKGGPIAIADHTLLNNGSPEELIANLNSLLKRIGFLL